MSCHEGVFDITLVGVVGQASDWRFVASLQNKLDTVLELKYLP